jgi:hypothetical protein
VAEVRRIRAGGAIPGDGGGCTLDTLPCQKNERGLGLVVRVGALPVSLAVSPPSRRVSYFFSINRENQIHKRYVYWRRFIRGHGSL